MVLQFVYQILQIAFTYAGPAMLNQLILSMQKKDGSMTEPFIYLVAMLLLSFLKSTCEGQANLVSTFLVIDKPSSLLIHVSVAWFENGYEKSKHSHQSYIS